MELVTGRAGTPHITSQQDRQRNQGTFGDGAYILKTGNQLSPVVQSSNKIQIKDGALMFQGALFSVKVGTVDEVTIANGNQGMKRKDLIVARYVYDAEENTESATWAVIQGTPAENNPVMPAHEEGDIQAGDTTVECPVLAVELDGINITGVELLPEIAPDVPEIMEQLKELNSKIETAPESTLLGSLNLRASVNTSVALSQSIDNFREILVIASTGAAGLQGSWFRPASKIDFNQEFNIFIQSQASYWQAANFKFPDKTHIQLTGKAVAGYTLGSMSVWGFK